LTRYSSTPSPTPFTFEIRYYLAPDGRSPFEGWFSSLNPTARAKVTVAIARLEQGNLSFR
jgi:hypothetical protein